MWPANALTERLRLKWPIIQAPMGIMSTPALAAAVSNAGGLGGLGMWGLSAEEAGRRIAGFRQQSGGSLNVNYPIWPEPVLTPEIVEPMRRFLQRSFYDEAGRNVPEPRGEVSCVSPEHLAMLLEAKPEAVSFHFGLPEQDIVEAIKSAGIFVLSSATTVAEARLLQAHGVDAVIAQGTEAGGHRATFTGTPMSQQAGLFSLLPQVVDAVRVPVIAAGGIADGRTAAAAFMLGASAVQMGTAFLCCEEANMQEGHRAALREASDSCTVVTDTISGRPARYIRNRCWTNSSHRLEAAADPGTVDVDAAARRVRESGIDTVIRWAIGGVGARHRRSRSGAAAGGRDRSASARFRLYAGLTRRESLIKIIATDRAFARR
jgi:nitronate monooxygenase